LAAGTALALALCSNAFAANNGGSPQLAPTVPPAVERAPLGPPQQATAPALSAADQAVADWLRDVLTHDIFRHVPREQDRAGVEAFYRSRGFAPIWLTDGAASPRAGAAIDFLHEVGADGLDPSDYPTPYFSDRNAYRLAADELMLANSVLTFARHALTGRVNYTRVGESIHFELKAPDPPELLRRIAEAPDVRSALDALNPQHEGYRALKAMLASQSPAAGDAPPNRRAGASRTDIVIANMERWRWLPRDLGTDHVMVNIADRSLSVVRDGRAAWSTPIVVGRRGKAATPLMSAPMKYVTVNPIWRLTASALRGEYLTAMPQDADASATDGAGQSGQRRETRLGPFGAQAASGHVRFDFPNRFAAFQRDLPDERALARGERLHNDKSMLVQDAEQYAQELLAIGRPGDGYTIDRIRALYGEQEQVIALDKPVPVHVTYQTAFVDDAGQLQLRPDIYGYDRDITALLRHRRDVADTPLAQDTDERVRRASEVPSVLRGDADDDAVERPSSPWGTVYDRGGAPARGPFQYDRHAPR
jgi:murein L,D-transpeptidase YcbB/YkuD